MAERSPRKSWIGLIFLAFLSLVVVNELLGGSTSAWRMAKFYTETERKSDATVRVVSFLSNASYLYAESDTGFDKAVHKAYKRAFESAPVKTNRRKFVLKQWVNRTNGGLTDYDRVMLAEYYSNATSVFEYGLGESTYIANYVGVPRYAGVDSDPVWVANTRAVVDPRFRFYFADIGKTVAWGTPKDESLLKNELDYQLLPLLSEPHAFDVYMVDGRWRIACLLLSFLHASARGADTNDTIVLIHDCYQENHTVLSHFPEGTTVRDRKEYRFADHLLNLVQHSTDYLCAYKRKPTTTDEQLLELWEKHHDIVG